MYKLIETSNIDVDHQFSISLEDRYENDFVKTAAKRDLPKEVDEAIAGLKRKKNHAYVLTTAMGDGETWGSNKNHDYFPYDGLLGLQNTPVWKEVAGKDERLNPEMEIKQRYQTFVDGHFFHHHRNKIERDPHFGYVPASIWNPKMRTVLLIIGVDRKKDPETAELIDRNELVSVSMGAKLPWDRCSICKNKRRSILNACDCLKFTNGKTLSDGRKVYAENLFPRFFDISKVLKPAFLAGNSLEKVAAEMVMGSIDLADYYDIGQFDKYAAVEKSAVLYKEIPAHVEGAIARVCNTEKDLPHDVLNDLSKLNHPKHAWGALTKAGIIAKPNEFAYILLKNQGHDELASHFLNANAKVSTEKPKGLTEDLHDLAQVDIDHKAAKIANSLPDHVIEERSIGNLNDRIYNTDKGLRKEAEVARTIGLGSILSALYLLYRKNAESTFNAYGLLGAGVSAVVRDKDNMTKFVGNDGVIVDEMNKHASFWQSGKGMVLRGLGGFALPYIASAHYQNKMQNGEQVGGMGRFIANNPGKLGLITGAAAVNPKAVYGGIKQVGGDLLSNFKSKK